MARFQGKRVLITGGTSGMGLAGARRIVDEGGSVVATGLNDDRIAAAQRELGEGSLVLRNDAGTTDDASSLAQIVAKGPPLDGLWLNAAMAASGPAEDATPAVIDQMMATNVRGPMMQAVHLLPHLNDGASIVLTGSSSAFVGPAGSSIYAASKGALTAVARSWATAFAPRRIRVNVLLPGPIDTNLRQFMSDEARRALEAYVVDRVPLGRVGTAEEAAAVALFLLSDDASFVTGSQYACDGGLMML